MEYVPIIYHTFKPNVSKYSIHGAYGFWMDKKNNLEKPLQR